MNARIAITIIFLLAGLLLALLPYRDNDSRQPGPETLLVKSADPHSLISVDMAARLMVREDSTVRFIDLRSPKEYREFNIPGSINIPFDDLLNPDWQGYLDQDGLNNILYSNGDIKSNIAWCTLSGMGYENNSVLAGGMNEWFRTVMNSKFEGERITPKENALFETRYRARKHFTQVNSLPDSLKLTFIEAKRKTEMELDGGCE